MHERFLVHLQLCFVVSFVLRIPGLEEGVIYSGKAWGWTSGTLIWVPGAPGKRTLLRPPTNGDYTHACMGWLSEAKQDFWSTPADAGSALGQGSIIR